METIADRSIKVVIGANVQGLVNGLKTADKAAQDWGNRTLDYVEKNSASLNHLAGNLGLVGAGLTGLAVLAVKTFADFDAAMSSVQASTMETAGNMELLRDAAIDAGSRTVYSATEAAGAIEELAKAGVSTADILGGGLDGALDLAASGAIDVGDAAEIAATAMTQFGLKGSDVTHIADLLAAGAGKAQGGVGDLGAALQQAGLVANQTGLSIEETTAGLTAFASAGLIGSDAGTSFKSMLQRLTPQSKEAEKAMSDLGISAYDSQGQFIGLSKFAQNLQDSLKSLTPEQRNSALATIFGSDAVRAATVLYEQGAKGIDEWTAAVDDQGYAAEQAAIRMDNLKGDLEGLSGSFETLLIGLGESADGPLRSLVQGLDSIVDGLSNMSDGAKSALFWVTGGAGLLALGAAGAIKMTTALGETITALKTMGVLSQAGAGRIGALAVGAAKLAGTAIGVAAVAYGVGRLVDALNKGDAPLNAEQLATQLQAVADTGDIAWLNRQFTQFGTTLGASTVDVQNFGEALAQAFRPSVTDSVASFFDGIPGVTGYMERLDERFQGVDESLSAMVESGNLEGAYQAFREIRESAAEQGITLDELREKFPGYTSAVQGLLDTTESATPAQDEYNAAMNSGGASAEQYAAALDEARQSQLDLMNVVLAARDAQRGFEASIDDATAALAENGATLDITTEKGRENQAALDAIAESGVKATEAMRENGATQGELQAQVQATRDRFIEAATAFGMSSDEAAALADQLNLIPENVTPTVAINDQASPVIDSVLAKFQRLDGRVVTTNLVTKEQTITTGPLNQVARASGGAVFGPGTGTSDSIPARLSNGEHVLTASDVRKMGGHGAVYALRAAVQSGRGYAGGGEVRQYVAPPVYQQPAQVSGAFASAPSFNVDTIVAADPREAVKEFGAWTRQQMAGVVIP